MGELASTISQRSIRNLLSDCLNWNRRAGTETLAKMAEDHLRNLILPKLGELPRVTSEDLNQAWRVVSHFDPSRIAEAHDVFCRFLTNEASRTWSSPAIAVGPPVECVAGVSLSPAKLWTSADQNFAVSLPAALPVRGGSGGWQLYAMIEGTCSRSYFDRFCKIATSALSTLLRCVYEIRDMELTEWFDLLGDPSFDSNEISRGIRRMEQPLDLTDYQRPLEQSEDGSIVECDAAILPLYDSRQFISDALQALFDEAPRKKKPMARRIKNGIRLIAAADEQEENALGLALSVAAIEAMLCENSEKLTQAFSENVTFLLEPEREHRRAAEEWARKLYQLRSNVLHGSDLDCTLEKIKHARLLAGTVLRAMLERRAAIRRVQGNDETLDGFMNELGGNKYLAGQLTHVSESPLKHLWRANSPKAIE